MIGDGRLLAVIPARGGSKRLPGKNILDLAGKPLIAWTIESALDSKYIDRVIVSTNDNKVATISKKYGADVPFMRPDDLSADEATSIDVILHSMDYFEKVGEQYEYIILLQPTSPLRTLQNINESIELLQNKKCNSVISVCETEHSPLWCNTIPSNGNLCGFLDKSILNKRSQDLPKMYRINGAIYLCNYQCLKKDLSFFSSSKCIAYMMDKSNSIDVDYKIDLDFCNFLIQSR
jgi:CMP-N,N'-diacetyllegionaminic acid synthase